MHKCLCCSVVIKTQSTYCSNKCQSDLRYHLYIEKWKQGTVQGGRGIVARNISGHVKRYLKEKYGEQCSECNWNQRNRVTGSVPLEIDHIDGDSENNSEGNLRLLCPNCHSLTPSSRNLNRGKGREWRRYKYLKINS